MKWFLRKSREGHNFFAFFKCNGIYCAFQSVIEGDEDSWIDFSQKVSNHYWSMETCQPSMSMFKSKDFTSLHKNFMTLQSNSSFYSLWKSRSHYSISPYFVKKSDIFLVHKNESKSEFLPCFVKLVNLTTFGISWISEFYNFCEFGEFSEFDEFIKHCEFR